jgi:peptidoglycan-associated lipoprotein
MQRKIAVQVLVLALVAGMGLVGCAKKKANAGTGSTVVGSGQLPPATGGGVDTMGGGATGERPLLTGNERLGAAGQFAAVYFAYDSAVIRPAELNKLQAVATAIKGSGKSLIVEGHCDERGTAEYNRALGERRAQAARTELIKLGVDGGKITTVSFGKDRPVEMGHDDTALSRNRRCEFVVTGN